MEKIATHTTNWPLTQKGKDSGEAPYAQEEVFPGKDPHLRSADPPVSRLNLEIIWKRRKWHLLKGKIIELVIEFTDGETGKIKSRGKVFYEVRKKQFYYIVSDMKTSFSSIHFCLKNYKDDMEKILYA